MPHITPKMPELKNSRIQIYLKLTTDGLSKARKKSFGSSRMTSSVFSSFTIVFRYLILVKKTCVIESKHLCLLSRYSGNCHSSVQIMSSDNCDDVSAKMKFLNSYDYTFNLLFSYNLQGYRFRSSESIPISHQTVKAQNKQCQIPNFFQVLLFCINIQQRSCSFLIQLYLQWSIRYAVIVQFILLMNNTDTNKIKPFPQLLSLG